MFRSGVSAPDALGPPRPWGKHVGKVLGKKSGDKASAKSPPRDTRMNGCSPDERTWIDGSSASSASPGMELSPPQPSRRSFWSIWPMKASLSCSAIAASSSMGNMPVSRSSNTRWAVSSAAISSMLTTAAGASAWASSSTISSAVRSTPGDSRPRSTGGTIWAVRIRSSAVSSSRIMRWYAAAGTSVPLSKIQLIISSSATTTSLYSKLLNCSQTNAARSIRGRTLRSLLTSRGVGRSGPVQITWTSFRVANSGCGRTAAASDSTSLGNTVIWPITCFRYVGPVGWPRWTLNLVMNPYAAFREMSFSSNGVSSSSSFGYICSHPIDARLPMQASGTRLRSKASLQRIQIGTSTSLPSSGKHLLHANTLARAARISSGTALLQSTRSSSRGFFCW